MTLVSRLVAVYTVEVVTFNIGVTVGVVTFNTGVIKGDLVVVVVFVNGVITLVTFVGRVTVGFDATSVVMVILVGCVIVGVTVGFDATILVGCVIIGVPVGPNKKSINNQQKTENIVVKLQITKNMVAV
jgi:hypothetical protein